MGTTATTATTNNDSNKNKISFENALSKDESLRMVVGLYSDDIDPDDPAEVERRLLERRKVIQAEVDAARQKKEAATIVASKKIYSKSATKDPLKDIKLLDLLMKKTDRIQLREERANKRNQKAEKLEQKKLLKFFASERAAAQQQQQHNQRKGGGGEGE